MEYVNLGRAGVKVSRICLGCMSFGNDAPWKLELDAARPIIKKAIDLGITFFDTANVYSLGRSEEITGECLKGCRDDVVVATKVYGSMGSKPNQSGLSRRHIMQQIRGSLKRLQMDHVDLYQIHRWDYGTPIDETLRAMDDVVHQGSAHYVGASSMFAWQFLKALNTSERLGLERFVSMQNHYNLAYREEEREMIPLCKEEGIALIPWSPLAKGFLTGKYKRGEPSKATRYESDNLLRERFFKSEDFDVLEAIEALAKEKGVTSAQVALAWLLHKGVTAPIVGPTKVEHIEDAVGAIGLKLNTSDMERLEAKYKPHPIMGHE
jgi:aryl-alcohol dehydrogenase-like predicted oxidoreductase